MRALAMGLVVVVLVGCGSEPPITGNWKGEMELPAQMANDPRAKAAAENMSLELTEAKTFKMQMGVNLEGTYARKGTSIEFTIEKAMGRPLTELKSEAEKAGVPKDQIDKMMKPLIGVLQADGTMQMRGQQGGGNVTFRRQTQ